MPSLRTLRSDWAQGGVRAVQTRTHRPARGGGETLTRGDFPGPAAGLRVHAAPGQPLGLGRTSVTAERGLPGVGGQAGPAPCRPQSSRT